MHNLPLWIYAFTKRGKSWMWEGYARLHNRVSSVIPYIIAIILFWITRYDCSTEHVGQSPLRVETG